MAGRFKSITVGNSTYQLPLQGTSPGWGEELSDLLEAMADTLASVSGPSDINETSVIIQNISGAKDIGGLAFDSTKVRSAEITYNLSRTITKTISDIPVGTGVIEISCSHNHNLFTGDRIQIVNSNSTPSINGIYTVTKTADDKFSIDISAINITVAGTLGNFNVQLVESGSLFLNYGLQGWKFSQMHVGDSKVSFLIDTTGQMTYNPEVLDGSSHSGLVKFIAKSLLNI